MENELRYLIWSQKHDQWWGPNRCGYTLNLSMAGRYDTENAADIVLNYFPHGSNIAVDETQAEIFLKMREDNGGKVVTFL